MKNKKVLLTVIVFILFLCAAKELIFAASNTITFDSAGVRLQKSDKLKPQKDAAKTDSQIIDQLKEITKVDTSTYGRGLLEKILGDSSKFNK